jgi:hypothetical protein
MIGKLPHARDSGEGFLQRGEACWSGYVSCVVINVVALRNTMRQRW